MESLLKIPLHLRCVAIDTYTLHTDATVLWPIFRVYEGEPVPEENLLLQFIIIIIIIILYYVKRQHKS